MQNLIATDYASSILKAAPFNQSTRSLDALLKYSLDETTRYALPQVKPAKLRYIRQRRSARKPLSQKNPTFPKQIDRYTCAASPRSALPVFHRSSRRKLPLLQPGADRSGHLLDVHLCIWGFWSGGPKRPQDQDPIPGQSQPGTRPGSSRVPHVPGCN